MTWLQRLRWRRAAIAYARKLPPHMVRAYGSSRTYTPSQVSAGVAAIGLEMRYLVLAQAAYLTPEDMAAYAVASPISYDKARALFLKHLPRSVSRTDNIDYGPGADTEPG